MKASTSWLIFTWLWLGIFAAFVAHHRGRAVVVWGILGLALPLIALLVCACLPRRSIAS
jgi:hypothetical protein